MVHIKSLPLIVRVKLKATVTLIVRVNLKECKENKLFVCFDNINKPDFKQKPAVTRMS